MQINFEKVKNGYSADQVDKYVNTISEAYTKLKEEYDRLQEELNNCRIELKAKENLSSGYRDEKREKAISEALIEAKIVAANIVEQAKKAGGEMKEKIKEETQMLVAAKSQALAELAKLREVLDYAETVTRKSTMQTDMAMQGDMDESRNFSENSRSIEQNIEQK